jgi:endonuclease-3
MNRSMMEKGTAARAIEEIVRRLEERYGQANWSPRWSPEEELVACILSQHTSDINSFRAFDNLKRQYATWDEVIAAPTDQLAETIRCGGLANSKAARIQKVLQIIREQEGSVDLRRLNQLSDQEARRYLMALPGVGPKTAAIVLCFALGRPVIPVDTHVFRVAWRLGLIRKQIGEARAHDALQELVPQEIIYNFHVALIQHGREVCKAPVPRCNGCPLTDLCSFYAEKSGTKNG